MFGTILCNSLDAREHAKALGIVVGRTYRSYNKGVAYRVVTKVESDADQLVVHYTDVLGRAHACDAQAFCEWTKILNTRKKHRR